MLRKLNLKLESLCIFKKIGFYFAGNSFFLPKLYNFTIDESWEHFQWENQAKIIYITGNKPRKRWSLNQASATFLSFKVHDGKIKQHSVIFTEPIYFYKLILPTQKLSSNVAQ